MAATRENVLAAIVDFVENNKRRAPAKVIAEMVGDTLPNVQLIIKALVADGAINSSRGRNGGALPDGVNIEKSGGKKVASALVEADPQPAVDSQTADQFAALMQQLEGSEGESASA